ncbi:MAG: PilZ domain-containing protein [Elusimicrobiota bacterium]
MQQDKFIMDFRKLQRHEMICSVIISDGVRESFGIIKNVSQNGLKLESANRFLINNTYTMNFVLPHGQELTVRGRFIWVNKGDTSYTYGAKIHDIGFLTRMRLKGYLKRLKSN